MKLETQNYNPRHVNAISPSNLHSGKLIDGHLPHISANYLRIVWWYGWCPPDRSWWPKIGPLTSGSHYFFTGWATSWPLVLLRSETPYFATFSWHNSLLERFILKLQQQIRTRKALRFSMCSPLLWLWLTPSVRWRQPYNLTMCLPKHHRWGVGSVARRVL